MMTVTGVASPDKSPGCAIHALIRSLDDLVAVLLQMPADVYTARPLPRVSGSVGEHVRHVLDHVAAFAGARPYGAFSYDSRERGTTIETDLSAALRAILRLKAMLASREDEDLTVPVTVCSLLNRGDDPIVARSTVQRELAFVVSHTIHHQALIAVLMSLAGEQPPDMFGVAPTTPQLTRS